MKYSFYSIEKMPACHHEKRMDFPKRLSGPNPEIVNPFSGEPFPKASSP